jgi:hypothetical protein
MPISNPDDDGWITIGDDEEGFPPLETEEGRDAWSEILLAQDIDDDGSWTKSLVVTDGENMIVRFHYPDGTEEVYDLLVRRSIVVVNQNEGESN